MNIMFVRITAILLVSSFQYLLAAENSTTPPLPSFSGNAIIKGAQPTEVQVNNVSSFVTENLLIPSDLTDQQPRNIDPLNIDYNFLKPRGKTKFTLQNIAHASNNQEDLSRNERKIVDQSKYAVNDQSDYFQDQELQLANLEKEKFIQSELHNLAKDIAETELNLETGKTKTDSRPSSWKSFFSSIFPQGIFNVFHLSVSTEPKKSKEIPTVETNRNFYPIYSNRNKRVLMESKLLIPPSIAPGTSTDQHLYFTESSTLTSQSIPDTISETAAPHTEASEKTSSTFATNQESKNGSIMTHKDVYDINSAAEVIELPTEPIISMESKNVFHIHPLNCGNKCSEDYLDEPSDSGDDNVVAFSRESPQKAFYPTQLPPSYSESENIRNSNVYYSGTGSQTSEEIVRENMKNFGQRIPVVHTAKQLDEFQKEVEKQFDHNEVIIDSEAPSRKFLKNFKGKYVKPQQSEVKANTFKGPNHFESISGSSGPDVKEQSQQSQPSPAKPESKLHTQIYSAVFDSDEVESQPSSPKTSYEAAIYELRTDDSKKFQDHIVKEKPSTVENLIFQYPDEKPENLPNVYNKGKGSKLSVPYKNTDAKEISQKNPDEIKAGNRLYTRIYSAGTSDDEYTEKTERDNEKSVQPETTDEKSPNSEELKGAYSSNIRPDLYYTFISSVPPKNPNFYPNPNSGATHRSETNYPPWLTPKPDYSGNPLLQPTQTTYLCSDDQLKNGHCSYSTTPGPDTFHKQQNLIEIQKSLEQEVKHTQPIIYFDFPPGPPTLSKNPIKVQQDDSIQSESFPIPESYEQHQKFLQDHQNQLNQQQEYFQKQQIQENQLKLLQQQQEQFLQKQREQVQKQQEKLQQNYHKQQEHVHYYQQIQRQQLLNQQQDQQDRLIQYHKEQQQQQNKQKFEQQKQHLQQYQQEQRTQKDQNHLLQMQYHQYGQPQEQQPQEMTKVRYNTVKVEKIVPKPYPVPVPVKEIVEKIVERPVHVEKIVEKPVNIPYPVREVVEKIVDRPYPVEKIIDRPVHVPYPVQVDHFIDRPYPVRVPVAVPVPVHQYIDRPYPVEKIVEKPIHVPYPVDKIVEKIVEKHIPVEVERIVEVEKPTTKKPPAKKTAAKSHTRASLTAAADAQKNKSNTHLYDQLELVPPPVDDANHDAYRTITDDVEFILLDDYNRPIPFDRQSFPWNNPEKRSTKNQNHNIKRSPEFRRNLRVEYGFRPPLIPSIEIGEKGLI